VPVIGPSDNSTIRNAQATITTIAPRTGIQMIHREILNLWLGALILSAMASASVSAASEWIPYNGTFPGMVGSLCSEAHPATYIAVRSRDEWVAYWEPLRPRIWQTPTTTTAPTVPQPEVDFSKYIVLVANSGCKPSGGYNVQSRGQVGIDCQHHRNGTREKMCGSNRAYESNDSRFDFADSKENQI
jgi:hypothetical protein